MKPENLKLAVALRHELHAHPELSMKEEWTRRRLIDFLREHTRLEIVERERWFYAVRRGADGARTVGLRADFDALPMEERRPDLPYASRCPGAAHKCGHDGHAATLAGLALELDQGDCGKNVVLLFQHAEETGQGAVECVETLKDLRIDEFYAYHNMPGYPEDSVILRDGTMQCASVGMTVELTGTPAHASSPEQGKNPAVAIARLACALPELSDPSRFSGLVLCTIVQIDVGQKAFGMSASRGELSVTVRAEREEELDRLLAGIEALARAESGQGGFACRITYSDRFPETRNDGVCAGKVRSAAGALGLPVVEMAQPFRGSEDFGHILNAFPGAIFYIGGGENAPDLHTYGYDFRDGTIETAVDMFQKLLDITP